MLLAKMADVLLAKMARHAGQYLLVLLLDQLLAVHADPLLGRPARLLDAAAQPLERVHAILCDRIRREKERSISNWPSDDTHKSHAILHPNERADSR